MPWVKRPMPQVGAPDDPRSLTRVVTEYLEWMRVRGYTEATIGGREKELTAFLRWCAERGLGQAVEVTQPILERYQRAVYRYRKRDGRPLSFVSQRHRLSAVKQLYRWLMRTHQVLYNPASELEMPRLQKRLPKQVLSAREAELVLVQADVTTPQGVRDRAMMELLYSTGIRRSELVGLTLYDVDRERMLLAIRQGKGQKDRLVPLGERALGWLEKYLDDVRPEFAPSPDDGALFLSHVGEPLAAGYVTHLVRRYIAAADIGKQGSCHLFRHTMATLMLENGADIRFIQAMLGHADLKTTQIYTQVSMKQLQSVHAATHPAETGRGGARGADGSEAVGKDEVSAEVVLEALAAEGADEEEEAVGT